MKSKKVKRPSHRLGKPRKKKVSSEGGNKKNRHAPLNQDGYKNGETKTQLGIFDMPTIIVEVSGTVKKKDRKHGEDSQPVDIVPSFLLVHQNFYE